MSVPPADRPGDRRTTVLTGLVVAATSLGVFLAASLAPSFGAPAAAPVAGSQLTSTLNTSFTEWMSAYQVPAASVAMMQDGRLVSTFGFGGMNAAAPARIASLSKAITAVCVARLVDAGRLSFTTPLGTVLARTFARLGQPVDPRLRAITIEQLLMHRSGLPREAQRGAPTHDLAGSFINILATPLANEPGAEMVYSNIGYLTLGMVIEAVAGNDYERTCRTAALAPMQAAGTIDPQLRQRASSGGWRVSAIDYARFIQVFEPGSAALGPLARAWQDDQRGYGLGIGIRRTQQGVFLTHTGRVALRERGGSLVVRFPNGATVVTIYSGDPLAGATADLRQRLRTAVAVP